MANSMQGVGNTVKQAIRAYCQHYTIWSILPYMKQAKLILRRKARYDDGAIREMVIWELPQPVPASLHPYKYRFFYGKEGVRIVGYDNERGKGDHKHIHGKEYAYNFTGIRQLVSDFYDDIQQVRAHES